MNSWESMSLIYFSSRLVSHAKAKPRPTIGCRVLVTSVSASRSPKQGGLLWTVFPDCPRRVGSPSFPPQHRAISSLGALARDHARDGELLQACRPRRSCSSDGSRSFKPYVATARQKRRGPTTSARRGRGCLLEPRQPHEPLGAGLCLRAEGQTGLVIGENSRYRDPEKVKAAYGVVPENTVNPRAVYADQSDLYRVQKEAVAQGQNMCSSSGSTVSTGPPPRPRPSSSSGKFTPRAKARASSSRITRPMDRPSMALSSPARPMTRASGRGPADRHHPARQLGGGYDARIAGPNPWTLGPLGTRHRLLEGAIGQ